MAAGNQELPLLFSSSSPAPPVRLVTLSRAARTVLWDLVADAKGDDALSPVTVAVPSPYAGLALRRELGAQRGLVNVRFMALARVAELLGAPTLAAGGRRPLAGPLRTEAVHAALAGDPGPFAAVADHPSTTTRLAATFRDLRRAHDDPAVLASRGARAGAVARLYADFRRRTADYYDEDDLLSAAAEALGATAHAADELGHVIVWLPTALSLAEEAFVRALADAGRATVVLAVTGDDAVDDAQSLALADRLGIDPGATDVQGDVGAGDRDALVGTSVLAAPDPEDEVRAVVRRVVARAEAGTPLHEVAIVYRLDEPYARLVPEVLDAAGVTWNGPSPRRLADGVVARVLLGVLRLADADLARDELAAWLTSGPILDSDGRRVPATRWDVVSREAGVVSGATQWSQRLGHHRTELERALTVARADEELAGRVRHLDNDLDTTDALIAFMGELADRIAPPAEATWAAHAAWAAALVARYVGGEGRRAAWPEPELEAARRVDAALAGLGTLDELGAPVDAARFRRALAGELDVPFGRVARFGTGVFVGPLRHAYGTSSACIFVLGMAEGSFPPRGREDPLLPDRERRLLGGLTLHADRRAEERRDYLAALASAPERVLCFPRADPRSQRRRLPARWLLETAGALDGAALTADDFLTIGERPWLDVVSSFEEGVTSDASPASITEYDVRSLAEWRNAALPLVEHPLATGMLGAGLAAVVARSSQQLTAFDGFVGSDRGLAPDATHAVSPTALQDWAYCPFRYLLARVLRVREVPKPEVTDTISALDEGTLVHAILEEFVTSAEPRTTADQPWTDAERRLLVEITEARCADAERRGITGRRLQWVLARRRIVRDVARFLDVDEEARAGFGVVASPDGLEMGFGDAATPVSLTLGDGRVVTFKGRVDRVDRSPDGRRAAVYDYKTGRPHRVEPDAIEAGTRLQLPVYALAAQARWGVDEVRAFYWYTRANADPALVEFPVGVPHRARFTAAVGTIVGGIAGGGFVAYPGERGYNPVARQEAFSNCYFCPYDRVCPPDRLSAWERKLSDPVVEPFHALATEPDASAADEEPA